MPDRDDHPEPGRELLLKPLNAVPIEPTAVYRIPTLATVFAVAPKTISRWELSGELPPSFLQGGSRCWLGQAVLSHLQAKQNRSIAVAEGYARAV